MRTFNILRWVPILTIALFYGATLILADEPAEPSAIEFDTEGDAAPPSKFYAAGTLERVRRKDNGSERIALTDSNGKIVAFLAPTARVDYRNHMGGEVAVKARILNSDDDGAPYVAVDSITSLGGPSEPARGEPIGSGIRRASFDQGVDLGAVEGEVIYDDPESGSVTDGRWTRRVGGEERVAQALPRGEIIQDGAMVGQPWSEEGISIDGQFNQPCGQCQGCGQISTGVPCPSCQPLPAPCGPPGWLWIRGEYLNWWADGMELPPLLITSTAAAPGDVGDVDDATARILYGDDEILSEGRSGYRLSFGGWFGPQRCWGYEGEFLELGDLMETFTASSNSTGNPILARPFFNLNPRDNTGALAPPGTQDVELVSFPNVVAGTFESEAYSRLRAAAGRLRFNICCKQCRPCYSCNPCDPCGGYGGHGGYGGCGGCGGCGLGGGCVGNGCGYPPYIRVDFTGGYRYADLSEGLSITEDLQSLVDPQRFQLRDSFNTRNSFNGGEVGTVIEMGRNRWTLDMLMRLALGGVKQQVDIQGQTTLTTFGAPAQILPGGLLAQSTNIGTYSRNDFAVVPELGANLGFYLTPRLRTIVGYTFFYFSNVVRPGDQIDLDVNPDFIPPAQANPVGLPRPEFVFRESSFWAQGINVGLDFRW